MLNTMPALNIDLRGDKMSVKFIFPSNFPNEDEIRKNIQDTITYSWNIKDFGDANIQNWLQNFTGEVFTKEDEDKIALWLLNNYTYYNDREVDHLCKDLYKRFLHRLAIDYKLDKNGLLDKLKSLCYIPLGAASESGGFIAYQFRKQAKIGIDRFFYPSDAVYLNGEIAVFIDDVTLSGTQAKTPILEFSKKNNMDQTYLLTLVASDVAISELQSENINTINCVDVDIRNKCFSEKSIVFHRHECIQEKVKLFVEHYGKKLSSRYPLGYMDGQYMFGFYYNTPNNTLPIFWSNKNGWIPLFERKEKIKDDARIWRTFESFI